MVALTRFDLEAAQEFARHYEEMFYQGDPEAMASIYTEDAKVIAQGSDLIVGRRAIEAFWNRTLERARSVSMKRSIHPDEIESSGDLGYQRGRVILELSSAQHPVTTVTSRYVTVWKREADGVWRLAVDISNTDVPVESGEFAYGVPLGE